MKTVYDLTCDELDELRESLYQQWLDEGIINIDIDTFDGVTDEMLFEHYKEIMFSDDDFFCNL